jgi:hypothetical protein
MSKLKPLSWEEFYDMHYEAWQNGWTYGPAYPKLYDDYLVNWIYFVDYLDFMIKSKCKEHKRFRDCKENSFNFKRYFQSDEKDKFIEAAIDKDFWKEKFTNPISKNESRVFTLKIFIGEAPPYWRGIYLHDYEKRNYFYHPLSKQTQSYFEVPSKIFLDETEQSYRANQKVDFLAALASKGFLLIDIFPFPINQDTKIRREVSTQFGDWIDKRFKSEFNKYHNYIEYSLKECKINSKKEFAIAMPLYGALQICFGETSRKNIIEGIDKNFFNEPITELKNEIYPKNWEIITPKPSENQKDNIKIFNGPKKKRYQFILDVNPSINCPNKSEIPAELVTRFKKDYVVEIPILTTGKQDLHHKEFINSKFKNVEK